VIPTPSLVSLPWVYIVGNEAADRVAKLAAENSPLCDPVEEGYLWETSFAHMSRVSVEKDLERSK